MLRSMKVALILLFALVVGATANDCTVVDYPVSSYTDVVSHAQRSGQYLGHCNAAGYQSSGSSAASGRQTGYAPPSGSTVTVDDCFNFCVQRIVPDGVTSILGDGEIDQNTGKVVFTWSGTNHSSLTPNSFHYKSNRCYCNYNDCTGGDFAQCIGTSSTCESNYRAHLITYTNPYANNMRTLDTNECQRHSFMTGKNFISVSDQSYPFGCSDQNGDTVYFNSQTEVEVHNKYYGNNDVLPINLKTVSTNCLDLPLVCQEEDQYVTGNTCTNCPVGWVSEGNNATACSNTAVTCEPGQFKENDACLTCPDGTYMSASDHENAQCNDCGEGATNSADRASCVCDEGFTGDWSESENKCLSCSTKLPDTMIECPSDHACPPTHHKVLGYIGYIGDESECCVCSNFDCAGECGGPSELVDGVCTDNAVLKTLKSTGGEFVKAGKTREQVKAFTILRKDAFNDIFDSAKTSEQKKQSRKNRAAYWKEQMKDYLSTQRLGKEKFLPIPKKNLRSDAGDDDVAYMAVPSTDGCNVRFEVTSEGLNYIVPDYDATCSASGQGQDIYVKCDESDAGTLVAKMTGVETFEDPNGNAITEYDVDIGVTVDCHSTTYSIQLAGSLTIEPTHVPLFQSAGSQCQYGTDPQYINKTQTEINAMNHGCVESMLEFTVFT